MIKTFSDLAQINKDHYDNHTTSHTIITVAGIAVVAVSFNLILRKLHKNDMIKKTGTYHK